MTVLFEEFNPTSSPDLSSLLAVHSICASHLLLSIHSLATSLGSDPVFLLSNIELGRVHWRHGSTANELVVDVNPDAEGPPHLNDVHIDIELAEPVSPTSYNSHHALVGVDPFVGEKRIILPRAVMQSSVAVHTEPDDPPPMIRLKGSVRASRSGMYSPRPELSYASYDL